MSVGGGGDASWGSCGGGGSHFTIFNVKYFVNNCRKKLSTYTRLSKPVKMMVIVVVWDGNGLTSL